VVRSAWAMEEVLVTRLGHHAPMAELKRFLYIYPFAGFASRPKLRGVFGDSLAVVVSHSRDARHRLWLTLAYCP
jgi:hypothetical protein